MMMARFVLTLLIGLVVSLGYPTPSFAQYSTDYWEQYSDDVVCSASVRFSKKLNKKVWGDHSGNNQNASRLEAWRRGLNCGVSEPDYQLINKELNTYALERSDYGICFLATKDGGWEVREDWVKYVEAAKSRGLKCGVVGAAYSEFFEINPAICDYATVGYLKKRWRSGTAGYGKYVKEAKRRGLSCGVIEPPADDSLSAGILAYSDSEVCEKATLGVQRKEWLHETNKHVKEARSRGLRCGVGATTEVSTKPWPSTYSELLAAQMASFSNEKICDMAVEDYYSPATWKPEAAAKDYVQEAKRRGLSCGTIETTQTVSVPKAKPKATSAALTAAEKEAERLRQRVAALEAKQKQQQQTIANDTQVPLITITQSGADGRKGSVKGYAKDNVQLAEVLIDGQAVRVGNDGSFEWSGFVPATGKEITIEAIDTAALSSTKTVSLKRGQIQQASGPRFDVLDPTSGKKVKRNSNALALIVGISDYERTDAPAVYADKDAQYFHDYASLKLGIPDSNIKTMVNAKAEQGDVILAVKDWMRRSSKPGKTDVYVFFAGHGLASDDGEQMYLLPYDGRPRLLDDTAIARERLFSDIASANPRSVTVFLDTCYSGTTRGTDMLIASRPIAIKALKQSIPDNFTVMTAARGDQTAKPLEEAKHGMFSYFLMKGMEGEADQNQDNKITAGELHQYVQSNVAQQSSGSQTPELQGDAGRVLVRFQ